VVRDDPRSYAAEAYRVLRANLHYANPDSPLRKVMITSAGAGEGKSTTIANLGLCFAQAGSSVLVIDADLRRPSLHTLFREPVNPGLSSYLAGDSLLEAVIQKTAVPNLSMVTSGTIPPNPAELLASRRMREFLETAAERFEVVLVDTPPVLAVSDPCILAPLMDGVILLVASGSPHPSLRRAKDQLGAVGAKVVGAVINRFDARAAGYSKRYYDSYNSYYGRETRSS
jgi:capsular exopolysaccharide synthesis family protein